MQESFLLLPHNGSAVWREHERSECGEPFGLMLTLYKAFSVLRSSFGAS
jgi:hypothetical protein